MDDGDGAYVNVARDERKGWSAGKTRASDRKGAKFYDGRH